MRKLNRKSISILAAATTLIAAGSTGAASLHKTVTLQVDGQSKTVSGFLIGSVSSLVQKQGIQLSDQDVVLPGKDAAVSDGMSIVVTHARQVLIKDGNNPSKELATTAATVADLLKQANIQLGEHDKMNTDLQSPPTEGQTIQITRRDVKVSVADEKIPFQTERQPDPDMYTGQERVLTRGVEGLAKITTTVVTENGAEIDRQQNRQVVQEPVSDVVSFGTKNRPIVVASRSGSNFTASKRMVMSATAYVGGGRTATGRVAEIGVAAVDPNVIPLGTKLYVEGYGYAVAADTGGAIKGNTIDLVFATQQEAIAFGRRQVVVYILP